MKTLDEVIFEAPYSQTPWEADALHYLKEYQQTRQDLLDGMKRLEGKELMFIHALANLEDNPPLTWDELREMKGKPVWVVVDGKEGWRRIRKVSSEHLILESGLPLHRCWMNQPDGWQAYRKERE